VKRVILQNGRAVGIEYVPSKQIHLDAPSESMIAYAKKLVVVSAGSWGSPAILERSGIGSRVILEKFGITQLVDLPGVGEHFKDHECLISTFLASEESATLDQIIKGNPDEVEKWNSQWLKDGSGLMASNGLSAGIKYRPNETELKTIGPAFEEKWKTHFANALDRSAMWLGCCAMCFGPLPTVPNGKYFGVGAFVNHPALLGSTHITSGEDPAAPHDFYPGDLEDEADMELHVFAYKRCREFARRMPCFRGEHPNQKPDFAEGSAAALTNVTSPVAVDASDIRYTKEDDDAIRDYVRKFAIVAMHSLGTCAMMPREQNGVVDSRLNVYGVEGLKVADLSIAPGNVGSNTHSTAVAIGEKAALIIAEELGISGV